MTITDTDVLNALLRGEISATETYDQALRKFSGLAEEEELRRMRNEHREAADTLRQHVLQQGGEPVMGSGWWGAWARFVEGTAKLFGKSAALQALQEGEEHGVEEYEEVLGIGRLPDDCKGLVRMRLMPQCHAHIQVLGRLIAAQSPASPAAK